MERINGIFKLKLIKFLEIFGFFWFKVLFLVLMIIKLIFLIELILSFFFKLVIGLFKYLGILFLILDFVLVGVDIVIYCKGFI